MTAEAPKSVDSKDVKGNTLDTSVENPNPKLDGKGGIVGDALAPAFANQADTQAQLTHAAEVAKAVEASRSEVPEASKDEKANMIEKSAAHTFINSAAAQDDVDQHVANQREADMKKQALDSGVPVGQLMAKGVVGADADKTAEERAADADKAQKAAEKAKK